MTEKEFIAINGLDVSGLTRSQIKFLKQAVKSGSKTGPYLIRSGNKFFFCTEPSQIYEIKKL